MKDKESRNAASNIRDFISDRGFTSEPIYRTDLDSCLPVESISRTPKLRHWRALEYATGSFSGVMLLAGPETAAPVITYPLGVQGW